MAAWKALQCLFLALAPWYASPDVAVPREPDAWRLRAFAGFVVFALMAALVARAYRPERVRSPAFVLAVSALVVSLVAGAILPRGTWPLGVSVYVLGPIVWGALLAAGWELVSPASRRALVVGWAVILAATAGLAWGRMHSRDAMWQAAIERDPSHERAWLARIEIAEREHRASAVRELVLGCDRAVPRSSACAPRAAVIRTRELLARASNERDNHRYNATRETLLEVLQVDRANREARMRLATLAHEAGAEQEARHHVEVLLRDHPGDTEGSALLREIDARRASPAAALRVGSPVER
jgi:hypothetical protein